MQMPAGILTVFMWLIVFIFSEEQREGLFVHLRRVDRSNVCQKFRLWNPHCTEPEGQTKTELSGSVKGSPEFIKFTSGQCEFSVFPKFSLSDIFQQCSAAPVQEQRKLYWGQPRDRKKGVSLDNAHWLQSETICCGRKLCNIALEH